MIEYVVWGVPPTTHPAYEGCEIETLLVAMPGGQPMLDEAIAERMAELMRRKGCTGVRVAALDMDIPPDFGVETSH